MAQQTSLNLYGLDGNRRDGSNSPKRELLRFLASKPYELLVHGPMAADALCLNLGNCLGWLAGNFDDNGPNFYADLSLGERPDSIKSLARQFQEVGRILMEAKPSQLNARVELLEARLARFEQQSAKPPPRHIQLKVDVEPHWKIDVKYKKNSHRVDLDMYRKRARL